MNMLMMLGLGAVMMSATSAAPASLPSNPRKVAPRLVASIECAGVAANADEPNRPVGQPQPSSAAIGVAESELVEIARFDVQYSAERRFRGTWLATLVERCGRRFSGDTAVLHFSNGMRVPFPNSEAYWTRLAAFVAVQVEVTDQFKSKSWASLPPAPKIGAEFNDRRPTRFGTNKVVVADGWHPIVPTDVRGAFSPWRHVDSLVRLEFVDGAAWSAQFPLPQSAAQKRGYQLFAERCQFCHSVRGVGAQFGWDFVEPIPLYTYRSPSSLAMHLRYQVSDAPEKGVMMPGFADLTDADGAAAWEWLKLVATTDASHTVPLNSGADGGTPP